MLRWQDSGQGRSSFNLADVQELAVASGFVFPETVGLSNAKRADLGAFFEHFRVNSLSAFKQKWAAYKLSVDKIQDDKPAGPRWVADADFVGSQLGGKRDGIGLLVYTSPRGAPILYIGEFKEGLKNGIGANLTSSCEQFHGVFQDDIMFGPGHYQYKMNTAADSSDGRHMIAFTGMFNGRPMGKGIVIWSTGEHEPGIFDGTNCVDNTVTMEDCKGTVILAERHAEMSKRIVAEVLMELERQGLGSEMRCMLGRVGRGALAS